MKAIYELKKKERKEELELTKTQAWLWILTAERDDKAELFKVEKDGSRTLVAGTFRPHGLPHWTTQENGYFSEVFDGEGGLIGTEKELEAAWKELSAKMRGIK
jgi:hypothetical protein